MKLSFRFRSLAAAGVTLTAGLIGCQINRCHNCHEQGRSEFVVPVEPMPISNDKLPSDSQPTPLLVPQSQVPPSEDEVPVPTAGLTPIQRTCFITRNACAPACSTCPTSCGPSCGMGFLDHMHAKMARSQCKMNAVRSRFHDLMVELSPCNSCSSCQTCSPCNSGCSSCDTVIDGYASGDFGYGNGAWAAPAYSAYDRGMWTPTTYGPMNYGPQYQAAYQPSQMIQPPCNCRQNQQQIPQQYGYAPQQYQQPYAPQQPYYQPQYAPPIQQGYAPPTYPTPAVPARVPQVQAPAYAPQAPVTPPVPGAS